MWERMQQRVSMWMVRQEVWLRGRLSCLDAEEAADRKSSGLLRSMARMAFVRCRRRRALLLLDSWVLLLVLKSVFLGRYSASPWEGGWTVGTGTHGTGRELLLPSS